MPSENTSLKTVTPAGESCTTDETVIIGKINTYQRTFLIVAGSLLALFVLIAATDKSSVGQFQPSA